jgi:hypothetical protein
MEVQIAVAKVNKYATSESGDTLEVVERPNGGLSVVLADGQTSGRGAKAISQMVVRRLNIASVDLLSHTIVLTRNNPAPIFICRGESIDCLTDESSPLGTSRNLRPLITEVAIEPGVIIVIYTDGLTHAGKRRGTPMDVCETIRSVLEDQDPGPQTLADTLLAQAVRLDENRPADDISGLVVKVTSRVGDAVRRMSVRLPIEGYTRE